MNREQRNKKVKQIVIGNIYPFGFFNFCKKKFNSENYAVVCVKAYGKSKTLREKQEA